ncbi:MAG TPA: UDP-2,3-diacylglucosamine diphosphatase [Longimicrobiaceae bacterium]|nr:UDP-2,3-diacylglucosamine diphosphatase [Longimicrobiaceae bacterium]
MESKSYFVVSDIHLGSVPRSTERAFRDFLAHVQEVGSGLLINGDLFDFWFEYRSVILSEHYRVLARLAELVEAGIPISFVGGNHDAWGGSFLRDEVGIQVLDGPVELDLGGRRALVVHGDGVGGGEPGYRMLRRFLRNPVTVRSFRMLHPDWGNRIAQVVSTTDAKFGNEHRASQQRERLLRLWAAKQLQTDPALELVIAGHTHIPEVVELLPSRYFLNAGDWINHFTYITLPSDGGAPELRWWPMGVERTR